MKILNAPDTYVETSGLTDTGAFTIKQSPKAFQILSSGLYSNKPLAIVRELSCNAYDAHVMVGRRDMPFEVKLPNKLDTQFYVKDFGPGLSHEQVMRLYTTYFDSTKTNSNDFIGGLGLGSKSPFSYTDSFTVESRQNGIARTYGAFVNDDGIPTIALMTEQATDEGDGLTVGFPVKPEDYDSFSYEARTFLRWISPAPTLKGASLASRPEPLVGCSGLEVLVQYPGPDDQTTAYYRKDNRLHSTTRGAWVRMGQVNYPLDWHAAGLADNDFVKLLTNSPRSYLFHAPIGSLNVAASREGLQYDKQGKKEVAALLKVVAGNLIDYLNTEVKALKSTLTGFEAGTLIQKITSTWGFDIFDHTIMTTLESLSGKKFDNIHDAVVVPLPATKFNTFYIDYFQSTNVTSSSSSRYHLTNGSNSSIDHRNQTLVVESDTRGYLRAISELQLMPKLEPYYAEPFTSGPRPVRFYGRTLVIVPVSTKTRETEEYKKEVSEFLAAIGSPLLRKTSEYASSVKKKSSPGQKGPVDEITGYRADGSGISYCSDTYQDTATLAWFPLDVGSHSVFILGKSVHRYRVDTLLKFLHSAAAQLSIDLPPIVGISKMYQRRAAAFKHAIAFDAVLDNFFDNPKVKSVLAQPLHLVTPSEHSHDALAHVRGLLKHLDANVVAKVRPLREITEHPKLKTKQEPLARLVVSMHELFGKGPSACLRQLDPSQTYKDFCETFPLFSLLTRHVSEQDFVKQSQLLADLTRYLQERADDDFSISWNNTDYQ